MFDIFYSGTRPNLFPHEREATDIEHARKLSRTRYFWWVNYLTDYSTFDFLFEPVPWQANYIHAWPSQWPQFNSACLVPKQVTNEYHYHSEQLRPRTYPNNFKTFLSCGMLRETAPSPKTVSDRSCVF